MNIANYVADDYQGWMLEIPADNDECAGMLADKITMWVSWNAEREFNKHYCELRVWWHDTAEFVHVADMLGSGYTEQLKQRLLTAGFSKAAVDAVQAQYTECNTVCFDAFEIGEEVRKVMRS